jgi:hypothetical protein
MPLTQVDQGLLGTYAQYTGFKNRIINGAMVIDQRNAGASVNLNSTGSYTVDRWQCFGSGGATTRATVQQNAGTVTPPSGFTNYLGVTSSGAYSIPAGEYYVVYQKVEGFNAADLAWGSASAQAVTLSFWVRSSLTGTFGGSIQNSAQNRNYNFSFSIAAANTWEYKTITVAGDTSGTWVTNNGIGLQVFFSVGSGSTAVGTAGSWGGTALFGVTGQTNIVATSGATFYITGVQLEKGSTATSFDLRPYGTELALCERYYQSVLFNNYIGNGSGWYWSMPINFNTMRTTPTFSSFSGGTTSNITYEAAESIGVQGCRYTILASGTNAQGIGRTAFASAEL